MASSNGSGFGRAVRDYLIPILTALSTAILGYLTFYIETDLKVKNADFQNQIKQIETELKTRDQALKEKIANLDIEIKQRDQDLKEMLSMKDYEIKIYNTVIEALKQGSAAHQEAAEGLVLVMIEREPLRSALLRVLAEKGVPEIKERIKNIVAAERIYKEEEREMKSRDHASAENGVPEVQTPPKLKPPPVQKVSDLNAMEFDWEETDFGVLWCENASEPVEKRAIVVKAALEALPKSKGHKYLRKVPASISLKKGFEGHGYVIIYDPDEKEEALLLQQYASNALNNEKVSFTIRENTPEKSSSWYLSIFLCPN
jgi:hypothetical protein